MDFFGLNFHRKYVPENSEPDEPIKPIPVTVKVIYGELKLPEIKASCESEEK